jgi:8-oxo-dGTP diphosphatase
VYKKGLFYKDHEKHYVAVDCVIFGFDGEQLNLLLIKRNFEPQKDKLSLMGGFVRKEESIDEAAKRVLKELTGLNNIYMDQLCCYGDPKRDTGERTLSIAYYALIKVDEYDKKLAGKNNAEWIPVKSIPKMIFDHNRMALDALGELRHKARLQPIGFELLPQKFTIPHLKKLYDAIYQKDFDKRNFSKKMLSMNILEKLNEKVRNNSIRAANLYKFDEKKYQQLLRRGYNFEM